MLKFTFLTLSQIIYHTLLWFLLDVYAIAGVSPEAGLAASFRGRFYQNEKPGRTGTLPSPDHPLFLKVRAPTALSLSCSLANEA
jgi:hypothetical protein